MHFFVNSQVISPYKSMSEFLRFYILGQYVSVLTKAFHVALLNYETRNIHEIDCQNPFRAL